MPVAGPNLRQENLSRNQDIEKSMTTPQPPLEYPGGFIQLDVEGDDPNLYPFTDTRPKFALPIANTPLLIRQIEAACKDPAAEVVLVTPPAYEEAVNGLVAGLPPAWRKRVTVRSADTNETAGRTDRAFAPPEWLKIVYPWHILTASQACLRRLRVKTGKGAKSVVHPTARLEGAIAIGRNVTIESGTVLKGPLIIGDDTVIHTGVYIEGPALIGAACRLGPHCHIATSCLGPQCRVEQNMHVEACVFFEHVGFGHFGYIGHSVCAEYSGGGGGTVLFDEPWMEPTVKMTVADTVFDTGLSRLGPMVGARVTTGASAVLMPGILLGPHAVVGPGAVADRNVPARTVWMNKQTMMLEPRGS